MVDQEAMFDDEEAMCALMYFLAHTSSFDLGCDICTTLPHLVKIIMTPVLIAYKLNSSDTGDAQHMRCRQSYYKKMAN